MACARHATSLQWLDYAIPVDDIDWNNAEDCRRLVRFTEFSVENVRVHQASFEPRAGLMHLILRVF